MNAFIHITLSLVLSVSSFHTLPSRTSSTPYYFHVRPTPFPISSLFLEHNAKSSNNTIRPSISPRLTYKTEYWVISFPIGFALDEPVQKALYPGPSASSRRTWNNVSFLGSRYMITVFGLYALGAIIVAPDSISAEFGRSYLTGLVVLSASISSLKWLTGRLRPYQISNTDSPYQFEPTRNGFDASFPSGHTAFAFFTATVFNKTFHPPTIVRIVTYCLASAVGLSRVFLRKHHPSDVLVGAFLGYALGTFAISHHF